MTRMFSTFFTASAIAVAALAATPASAALTVVGPGCSAATPAPDAIACRGAFSGNLNSNSRIGDLNAALDLLVGGAGYSPDVTWAPLDATKTFFSGGGGNTVNFGSTLFGQNIISMHFGDAGSGLGDHTILYLFDFGAAGANSVDVGQRGWSNAVLIPPAVPEPGTWAMMLLGFGATGFALRRSRRKESDLLQIA